MPFFSVIIANYNHASFLKQRIDSVLSQTFDDYEIIILDDASNDNSTEIINSYSHSKISQVVFNEQNSGSPFLQWKKGIDLAKADWIWIAESDDIADAYFLDEAFRVINKHSTLGFYYSDSLVINEEGKVTDKASDIRNDFFETKKWSASYLANGKDEINECLKYLCTINNSSALVFKKEIFKNVQEQVIQYKYYGDWFFFIHALLHTDIYYNHKPLSSYRNHPANFVTSHPSITEPKKEYYKLLLFLLSRPEIKEKKKIIRFFCIHYLGTGWLKEGTGNSVNLFRQYVRINKSLACKVVPKLIWYKLTRQKNKKRYP